MHVTSASKHFSEITDTRTKAFPSSLSLSDSGPSGIQAGCEDAVPVADNKVHLRR